MRACCFDLETTGLYANFGVVLCGVVKAFPPGDGTKTKSKIYRRDEYPHWKDKRSDDSEICGDIFKELQKYDIWIAHNGVGFDVNFLRTRLIKKNITVPQPKIVDPVRLARRYLRLSRNDLGTVSSHLGLGSKTIVDGKYWNEAALDGSISAMNYITKHCVIDVQVLEDATNLLRPFVPRVNTWGSDT